MKTTEYNPYELWLRVRLDPYHIEKLNRITQQLKTTRSEVIRKMIESL